MASHHPHEEFLLEYSTGALTGPMALAVATHLALCPHCRERIAAYETIGGAMLESETGNDVPQDAFDRLMAGIEAGRGEPIAVERPETTDPEVLKIPRPLRDRLPGQSRDFGWRRYGHVDMLTLDSEDPELRVRLLRIDPEHSVPRHTHEGVEMTVVLEGSFSDTSGRYARGDMAITDETIDHRPIADPGTPCLCLTVTTGRLNLTGRIGRLFNRLIDI